MTAPFHCASWPTSRPSTERMDMSSSIVPIGTSIGASSCSSVSRPARSSISEVSQTWCSTMRVMRSIGVTFREVGSRRLPGGWKCTPDGPSIWVRVGC